MWITVGLMLVAMTLIPLGDTAGKLVMQVGIAPIFVAWARFAMGALLLVPVRGRAVISDLALLGDWRIWLRAALIVGAISSILTALKTEPIANVFGAFFIGPIISFVLSAVLLGERVTVFRALLMALGFVGVLLVVKPGFGMTPGLTFAVMAGGFYGAYLVASRWLARVAAPTALMLTQLVVGALLLAPFGLSAWPEIDARLLGLLVLSGAASMLGNVLLTLVYGWADASALAPFVYFQLVAAAVFGALIFNEVPDLMALAGLALLVASGFASLLHRTVR